MKKIKNFFPMVVYFILFAISELIFWRYKNSVDLGDMMLWYFILFPLSILVISAFYGFKINGKSKYFLALFFGISVMLFKYTTTSLGNMIEFNKTNIPDIITAIIYGIISLVGILVGNLIKKHSKTK